MPNEAADYLAYEKQLANQFANQTNSAIESEMQTDQVFGYGFRACELVTGAFSVYAAYRGEYVLAAYMGSFAIGFGWAAHAAKKDRNLAQDELLRRSRQEG